MSRSNLPASTHSCWRHRLGGNSGTGVDDRNRITDSSGSWLMKFEGCWLALVGRNVRIGVGVESEAGVRRNLMRLWT
jgi:hypothetical protein